MSGVSGPHREGVGAVAQTRVLLGKEQALKVALAREHSKVLHASEEEKLNVALFCFVVPECPESMVVSGAVVSCGGGGMFTVEVPHCPLYPSPSHRRCDARQRGSCRSWGRCTQHKLPRRGSTRT